MFTVYELKILDYVIQNPNSSSSEIHNGIDVNTEIITTKRKLSILLDKNSLVKVGIGRATRYIISNDIRFVYPINIEAYFQ